MKKVRYFNYLGCDIINEFDKNMFPENMRLSCQEYKKENDKRNTNRILKEDCCINHVTWVGSWYPK